MNKVATILLVEDEPFMLDGMRDLLNIIDIGYTLTVLTAENGLAGLEAMQGQTPDLIITDIMMPKMDGYQFLERVRENPNWVHIPIIFLTAKSEEKDIRAGKIKGANLYITKPFQSENLRALIQTQLDRKFQLQVTRQQNIDTLKKDILQILNHEFRTPLTYVTAYYDMLADSLIKFDDQTNFQEYLRGIQVGCIRMTKLVEDFIQVIELHTGEARIAYQQQARPIHNLDALLQEVITASPNRIQPTAVQINFDAPATPPTIYGDWHSLKVVFNRLIDNAIKFTHSHKKQSGVVQVSLKSIDDQAIVQIRDQGIGFPTQAKDKLFELFFQYNRDQFEQQGAGIGLTLVKGLVELHNGHIEVESIENEGSTFTVVLPIYDTHHNGVTAVNVTTPTPQQATILIVEDDQHLLIGLQELLEISEGKYKFNVITAVNGQNGLARIAETQPQLIISDIMMPHMDGYEFLKQVRQNPHWVHIPFIFLTARGEGKDIHTGLLSGAEEYITKPYDSDLLMDLVNTQLNRYFQMQNALNQNFDHLKRGILNIITPDFQDSLSSVNKHSESLATALANAKTNEELKASLQGIQDGSIRLTKLVEDFISLAELKTGEAATVYTLRAEPISNLSALLRETIERGQIFIQEQGGQLQGTVERDLPTIYGVSPHLMHSIYKLIEVGSHYYQHNEVKDIHLTAQAQKGLVQVTIHFNHNLSSERFSRLTELLTEEVQIQLELSDPDPVLQIIQGQIALHNGHIDLLNQTPHGFSITIILPVYTPAPEQFEKKQVQ